MNRHPYSAAWPDMSPNDFAALVESIRANGLSKRIMRFEGSILDGWHRYRACLKVGIAPLFEDFPGDSEAACKYVEVEHTRRNLLAGQRVAAILEMHEYRTGAGRPGNSAPGTELTAAEIAKRAGTSTRTVEQVKEVAAKAPAELELIRTGTASAKKVLAEIKGKPEKPAPRPAPACCPSCAELTDELHTAHGTIADLGTQVEAAQGA